MKDHEIILRMIEEVSVDDSDKLNEINARVWVYTNGYGKFLRTEMYKDTSYGSQIYYMRFFYIGRDGKEECYCCVNIKSYTLSRDALKSIRPEGYIWGIDSRGIVKAWKCVANHPKFESLYNTKDFRNDHPKTEELAELHAIIQAIAYEKGASHE